MRKYLTFGSILFSLIIPLLAAAALEVDFPEFGGQKPTDAFGPANWVNYIFLFGLGIVGLAVIGSLVWAGLEWMTAGGNPGKIESARDRIKGAILGLIVLMGSYILLRTINPQLVSLKNPSIRFNIGSFDYGVLTGGLGGGEFCEENDECRSGECEDNECTGRAAAAASCSAVGADVATCGYKKFCSDRAGSQLACIKKLNYTQAPSSPASAPWECFSGRTDDDGTCTKSTRGELCDPTLDNSQCSANGPVCRPLSQRLKEKLQDAAPLENVSIPYPANSGIYVCVDVSESGL